MSDIRIDNNGSSIYNGITVNTPFTDESENAVKVEDFLQLMVAQLANQDFMNPVDDTQYIAQLAQFASMQAMQELSQYSQTNYVATLAGKTVTVATLGLGGSVSRDTGMVTSVNLSGDTYTVTVNGNQYELSQIMSIDATESMVTANELSDANGMALIKMDSDASSIALRWLAPISDETAAAELRYDVYISENGNLDHDNVSDVKQGTRVASNLSDLSYNITGLESGKTYFINVVVRNIEGDEAVYQHSTITI